MKYQWRLWTWQTVNFGRLLLLHIMEHIRNLMHAICRILHQVTGFDPNHEWTNIYNYVTINLAKHDLNGISNFDIYFQK